jgi:hypothetical protein
MMSGTDFIKEVIIGTALGGVINGTIAKVNGLTFWRGTLPKVQAITLPSPAGLSNVGSTSQEPKVDVKLPKTAEVSTTSTTQANTTNNVTITENVDGSGFKVDGLGIEKQNVLYDQIDLNSSAGWKGLNVEDLNHHFSNIVDNNMANAAQFSIKGGDGITRSLYQVEGALRGKSGIFEWLVDSGKLTHRVFIPNGKITGIPNKW